MSREDSNQLFRGAFILTAAALITKILSAVYRVPFQNIVGDVGFYIYQQVYPIYGIALALSTYGFPVIISRMIAEESNDMEGAKRARDILRVSFLFLSIIGILLFLFFHLGSSFLAGWMGDAHLAPLIKIISFSFLMLPFLSTARGFFQGKGNMAPTAFSQVAEQLIRVATILTLSWIFVVKGKSLYEAGGGALYGSLTGGVSAIILLFLFIRRGKEKSLFKLAAVSPDEALKWSRILLFQGTAVCISGMLLVLLQLADSLSLYSTMVKAGMPAAEAKIAKGIYDRGQPLIQLGTVLATSLSLTLVPLVTAAYKKGKKELLEDKITIALKVSVVAGVGAAAGLINLLGPVNEMLFENKDGTGVLQLFSFAILFSSVILTLLGILQGLGHPYAPMKYILCGVLLKYAGNIYLVRLYGTKGAAIATIIALLMVAVLLLMKVRGIFGRSFLSKSFYIGTVLATGVMTVVLQLWLWAGNPLYSLFSSDRAASAVLSLSGVAIGGLSYVFVMIKRELLTSNEMVLLPFGSKLLWLQNQLRKKR